jgi:hypothetical protein
MLMWLCTGCCRLVQATAGALVIKRERKKLMWRGCQRDTDNLQVEPALKESHIEVAENHACPTCYSAMPVYRLNLGRLGLIVINEMV